MANNIFINLQQTVGQETNVPAQLVTKLYTLWKNNQNGVINWDYNENSIKGTFKTGYTYDKYVDKLHEIFEGNLTIIPEGYYVYFEDLLVESILLTQLVQPTYPDKNYEGVIAGLLVNNTGNANNQGFKKIFKKNEEIQTFDELSKLTNVKSLAAEEFWDCKGLRSIDLTNIETLNDSALRSCVSLEYFNGQNSTKGDLSLPHLKTSGVGSNAFYWFSENSTWKGPKVKCILDLGDCEKINSSAFNNCKTLEYVDESVFEKLTTINTRAFEGCENLVIDDLKLPNTSLIGSFSFAYTKVKKISELGVCQVNQYAFQYCSQLTTITDEALSNITYLEEGSFYNCTNLVIEDLKLPNLTFIGRKAFEKTKVKSISDLGNVSTVTGFTECTQLTSVTIPSSATTIGSYAFQKCTNLNVNHMLNVINYFDDYCFQGILSLPSVLSLPNSDKIGYTPFLLTNVRSIYLPKLLNTNGLNGTKSPKTGRENTSFRCGDNMSIFYLKNINKINGWSFGGESYCTSYTADLDPNDKWYVVSAVDIYGRHIINNTIVPEYKCIGAIPFKSKGVDTDGWGNATYWANIKYLVINNITPPDYWQSTYRYGAKIKTSSFALYQKHYTNGNETFHYLVVPRSAINTYLNWEAFHPDFSSPNLEEEDRQKFISVTTFNNDDPSNPRIIAIESMGHFATKAEYDAAPDMPDGVHNKEEYLIEEYMGLGPNETINWDPTPTWGI